MSDKSKKIFLLLTIIGSFMIYSVIYYAHVFKNAPYKFSEFKSIVYKYGYGDSLINSYNSLTGEYQYVNKRDSLVKSKLFLNNNDLLFLHFKATELGLWDFPSNEMHYDTSKTSSVKPLHYLIEFNYNRKGKKVMFAENFDGPLKLVDANNLMIKAIDSVLAVAQDRQRK